MDNIDNKNNYDKNHDLEEELNNSNLDFLEEDNNDPLLKLKDTSNVMSNQNNIMSKKPILWLIIAIVTIFIISIAIINYKKSKKTLASDSYTNQNNTNKQNDIKSIDSKVNDIKQAEIKTPEIKKNEDNKTISSTTTNTDSINELNTNKTNINNLTSSNNDISQLHQIGQIQLPQPAKNIVQNTTRDLGNNQPEDANLNNSNLSWQDIKKSIENNATTTTSQQGTNITTSPLPTGNIMNPNNVHGFERTANNIQVAQAQNNQANEDYRAQQEYVKELKNIISNMSKDLHNNIEQIKELQNNLIDISKFMSNINVNVNNIDNKVQILTKSLDTLSTEVNHVKKYIQEEDLDLNVNLKSSEPDLFSSTPEYIVHAIIPGRAWLKNTAGQIITIAEGDQLGDYGKITLIDANNNLVRTSSGVIFR